MGRTRRDGTAPPPQKSAVGDDIGKVVGKEVGDVVDNCGRGRMLCIPGVPGSHTQTLAVLEPAKYAIH